jgi:hypothetical protein
MGQSSSPDTLVSYQKTTPGKNPKDFIQHYDRGGSLQSFISGSFTLLLLVKS